jgi:peroxiredoxin
MNKFIFLISILIQMSSYTSAQQNYKSVKEVHGLEQGDKVSDFNAKDQDGNTYQLSKALENGPVVLILIRGQWCPFCNKHLGKIQDSLELIYAKGASVVVVSPETSEFLKKTQEKTGAEFTLLYDEDYKIAEAFDVKFRPDSLTRLMYNTILGANLKNSHSDDSEQLPVPATFIIGKDNTIQWRHFDRDYKKRSNVKDILSHL